MNVPLMTVILGGVVLLGAGTALMVRRRRRVWRRFAAIHRLEVVEDTPAPTVQGTVGGLPVRLAVAESSSDTGWMGMETVRLEVGLDPERLPADLEVRLRTGVEPDAEAVPTGDAAVDETFIVTARDPGGAVSHLSPRRVAALAILATLAEQARVGLDNGQLWLEERRARSRLAHLEQRLHTLLAVARDLGRPEESS